MVITKGMENVVKRWNKVFNIICVEHITINTNLSELDKDPKYYDIEDGITVDWMINEAKYWLSCYYEVGHCRCDDRFLGEDEYKEWVSETGYLKRLIKFLEKFDPDIVVVEAPKQKEEQDTETSAEATEDTPETYTISYNGNTYNKLYSHEDDGTYYSSSEANFSLDDWLDVYPDGTVYRLLDHAVYFVGWLVDNIVVTQGQSIRYTADDFDGHTKITGVVSEMTEDSFIIQADGMNLWIDQDNLSNVSII